MGSCMGEGEEEGREMFKEPRYGRKELYLRPSQETGEGVDVGGWKYLPTNLSGEVQLEGFNVEPLEFWDENN